MGRETSEKDENEDEHDLEIVLRFSEALAALKLLNHPFIYTALARLLNKTFKFGVCTGLSETQGFS